MDRPIPSNPYETVEANQGGDYATVLVVDPLRQVVSPLDSSDSLSDAHPMHGAVGADGEGDFSTPIPGWRALRSRAMGIPSVSAYIPGATMFKGEAAERDDYGDEINTFLTLTGLPRTWRTLELEGMNFRSHRPSDLIAGDMGFRTPEGATVYAGRGGIAGVKVSDLAQILFSQVDDLARIVSRNFDLFSDWGEMRMVNEGGKARLHIKGNAKGANTWAGRHDVEIVIGASPSSPDFITMQLLDKKSQKIVYRLGIDQSGNQHTFLAQDQITEILGDRGEMVAGGVREFVGKDVTIDVEGEHTTNCDHVHVGGRGGEKAPMGEMLYAYLLQIKMYMDSMYMLQTSMGPTMPGGGLFVPFPDVPDFLSKVVDYPQNPVPRI